MRRGRQLIAMAGGLSGLLLAVPGLAIAQTPVPATGAATQISSSGAVLAGTVAPGGPTAVSYRFAYGSSPTTLNHLTTSTAGPSGTEPIAVSTAVNGLSPNTTYYFKLIVRLNRTSYSGAVQSFTTLQLPVVSTGTASGLTPGGAVLGGTLNPGGPAAVTYQFAYGTSASHLDQTTPSTSQLGGTVGSPVSATVNELSPGTTYYFRLTASFDGQTVSGAVESFATPQVPVVTTGSPSAVSPNGAVLGGTVNPSGPQTVSYRFAYGTLASDLNVATAQQPLAPGISPSRISTQIAGLSPHTTYYYRVEAIVNGETYPGPVQSFTTAIPQPDTANAHTAWVTNTAAILGGQVSPNGFATSYHFDYGPTSAYGHSSPSVSVGAGASGVPVTFTLSGLLPRTTYHFRLVAENAGGTVTGQDEQFTTGSVLLKPPHLGLKVSRRQPLATALRRGLAVRFSCSAACTVHLAVTLAPGAGRGTRLPLNLARRDVQLSAAGSRAIRISLPARIARALRRRRTVRLVVSAYAVGNQTSPGPSRLGELTLI